jgi:Metallo-beta-lactamase superfamily
MSIERIFDQVNPGSMAARDPWRSGRRRPRHPITRVSWSAPGTVSIHPDTWHRPGSDLPVAAHLTTLDQAAAHQRLCRRAPRRHRAVRHPPGAGVGHRPGLLPRRRHLRFLYDRLATRFDIGPGATFTARLEAIGYDLADVRTAVLSHLHQNHIGGLPELERRPGHRSRARRLRDLPRRGVPVAAGRTACATTGEREAPPRSRLARTRPSAGGGGPSAWSAPRGRDGRVLGRRRLSCTCFSRMCQSRSLLVLNSRPPVTHFTGIGGPLAAPGASPVARRPGGGGRTASRIDQLGACSKGPFGVEVG